MIETRDEIRLPSFPGGFHGRDQPIAETSTGPNSQPTDENPADRCNLYQKEFIKCLDTANGDSTQCQGFWEALKVSIGHFHIRHVSLFSRNVNALKVLVDCPCDNTHSDECFVHFPVCLSNKTERNLDVRHVSIETSLVALRREFISDAKSSIQSIRLSEACRQTLILHPV